MRKRWWSILLVMAMCLTMLPVTALAADDTPAFMKTGEGTEESPYLLSSAQDLLDLADFINDGKANELDKADDCILGTFHGYYFQLTKDIDMSGKEWTPISFFCGNLDGAGHTISNLDAGYILIEGEYGSGFFYQIANATVTNLYFENCSAEVPADADPTTSRDSYAAILTGSCIASSIKNCCVIDCTVEQNMKEYNLCYAGGIVAIADISHISNCSVQNGTVSIGGDAGNGQYAGGIVGCVLDQFYTLQNDYKMTIGNGEDFGVYNCFVSADVTTSKYQAAGGIVGWTICDDLSDVYSNCYFTGNISSGGRAGGIIGDNDSNVTISNCSVLAGQISGSTVNPLVGDGIQEGTSTPVTVSDCILSNQTIFPENTDTNISGLTTTSITEANCQIENFKSNLHGIISDKSANVTISLYKDGEESAVYTTVTDADGEYNFGKNILPGTYTVKISADDTYKEFTQENVEIRYATNETLDITREAAVTGVLLDKDSLSLYIGDTATLTAQIEPSTASNQTIIWTSNNEDVATVDENGNITAVGAGTATITATTEDGGYTAICEVTVTKKPSGGTVVTPTYPPTIPDTDNGDVTISPTSPKQGDTVTVTPKPDNGYEVDKVTVTDSNGKEVEVKDNGDGTYSFTQPNGKVTITVTYKATGCPKDSTCPISKFTDASATAWYHDGVHYVLDEGLMFGIGDNKFAPNATLTRAELAQILYNKAGKPTVTGLSTFTDVPASA